MTAFIEYSIVLPSVELLNTVFLRVCRIGWISIRPLLLGLMLYLVPSIWFSGSADGQELEQFHRFSENQVFIAGLRDRGLFDLAEFACKTELQNESIDATSRTDLVIELLKTQSLAASSTFASDTQSLWAKVDETANFYTEIYRSKPRTILIEVQKALTPLARATRIEQEYRVRGKSDQDKARLALSQLRLAIERMRKVLDRVQILRAQRAREKPRDEFLLTAEQLATLANNIQVRIAECNLKRAEFYPADDRANRVDTLTQVLKQLESLNKLVNVGDPIWLDVQLMRAHSERMLGRFQNATTALDRTSGLVPGSVDWQRVRRQRIQLAIAAGNSLRAAQAQYDLLQDDPDGYDVPELNISIVQLFLEAAKLAPNEDGKQVWQDRAVSLSKKVELRNGNYWGRIADMMLVDVARTNVLPSNIEILSRLAEQYRANNQLDRAVETYDLAYDQAMEQAVNKDQIQYAFTLGYIPAHLRQSQKKHDEASERFRLLANRFSDHPSAADAHLLSCWNKAQAARSSTANPNEESKLDQYRRLLHENINNWPESSAADQARLWLATVFRSQKNASFAIQQLVAIHPKSKYFKKAAPAISELAIAAIEQVPRESEDPSLAVGPVDQNELLARLSDLLRLAESIDSEGKDSEDNDSLASRSWLTIAIAQIQILKAGRFTESEALLRKLNKEISGRTDRELFQKQELVGKIWLIAALSQQSGKGKLINELSDTMTANADSSNDWLAAFTVIDPDFESTPLSKFKIGIANKLLASNAGQRQKWESLLGDSLLATGSGDKMVAIYRTRYEADRKNLKNRVAYSRALAKWIDATVANEKPSPQVVQEALVQWRSVVARVKKESPIWWEGKFRTAQMLKLSGESKKAQEFIRYVQATSANWKQNPWGVRLQNLLDEITNDD